MNFNGQSLPDCEAVVGGLPGGVLKIITKVETVEKCVEHCKDNNCCVAVSWSESENKRCVLKNDKHYKLDKNKLYLSVLESCFNPGMENSSYSLTV